jgi:hypothetical protein
MTPQEKETLRSYGSAKIKEKEAKKITKELREQVDAIILKNTSGEKGDQVIIEIGKFSVGFGRKYTYPDEVILEVEKLNAQIKEVQADSERKGEGEYVEKLSLTFKETNGHKA